MKICSHTVRSCRDQELSAPFERSISILPQDGCHAVHRSCIEKVLLLLISFLLQSYCLLSRFESCNPSKPLDKVPGISKTQRVRDFRPPIQSDLRQQEVHESHNMLHCLINQDLLHT